MRDKILKLDTLETFWEDTKRIVGYYEDRDLPDWLIKELQRVADFRYEQLKRRAENDKN